jgi:hypothetical protein
MRRQRRISPWAQIALREAGRFGEVAARAGYQRLAGAALALALLVWLSGEEYPTFGLVVAGLTLAAGVWLVPAGRRELRIAAMRMERRRRRYATAHPGHPDWSWAVMRAQEASPAFGWNAVVDYRPFALLVASGCALGLGWRNAHIERLLGEGRIALFLLGCAGLVVALAAAVLRAERERKRIRRAVFEARCIRCGYQIMRPADRRHPIRCPICPECGYRYPLHPPPASGSLGLDELAMWRI